MIVSLVRRAAAEAQPVFNAATNPFKARKQWPPDFNKLSPKHQFRLERKYKRRAQLKWARPKLMIATKLAQWGAIAGVLVYGVLFMEWDPNDQAFKEIRASYHKAVDSFWTKPQQPRSTETKT